LVFSFLIFPSEHLAGGDELSRLKELSGSDTTRIEEGALRDRAQKEAAYSSAIQAGTLHRYQEILEKVVTPHEKILDSVFDFQRLMIKDGDVTVQPPVLTEAGEALRVSGSGKSATYQSSSYFMLSKAKIVSVAPNWRAYLYLDLTEPEEIHQSLLPLGSKEKALWRERIDMGWQIGLEQADELFKARLAKLTQDFTGLLLYEELKGELSPPELDNESIGKVVSDRELSLGLKSYNLSFEGSFEDKK
jgi:defect-in-organelle-trafficking protein DotC